MLAASGVYSVFSLCLSVVSFVLSDTETLANPHLRQAFMRYKTILRLC